ncbi:MAG: tail fiber protein [Caldilineales bacterium]
MSDEYIGEIKMFGFNFAPVGWLPCNGQMLSISQNTALFSILGTTYGGDGRTTFALPNLQGQVPISMGSGPGLSQRFLGETGGEVAVTLTNSTLPSHSHAAAASSATADQSAPTDHIWASGAGRRGQNFYATDVTTPMHPAAIKPAGGSQPHNNMPPYLTLNICICIQGIYPPRS